MLSDAEMRPKSIRLNHIRTNLTTERGQDNAVVHDGNAVVIYHELRVKFEDVWCDDVHLIRNEAWKMRVRRATPVRGGPLRRHNFDNSTGYDQVGLRYQLLGEQWWSRRHRHAQVEWVIWTRGGGGWQRR